MVSWSAVGWPVAPLNGSSSASIAFPMASLPAISSPST
jgi:hypothetical protein